MNQAFGDTIQDGIAIAQNRISYEPSVVSSVISSSQISVFSDAASVQSSTASSVSDDFRPAQDDLRDRITTQAYQYQLQQTKAFAEQAQYENALRAGHGIAPSYAEVTSVPQEQRQHPRRCSVARNSRPPSLVRQSERKVNFVDNLVDSATQMVEVIWPLSVVPSNGEVATGKGVLPLRIYIEETLRRSRTSYSTLQVALYYLVLIKQFVPSRDFTMEQKVDCVASRALMCGRRMFLAALILASKYLQDRNYSAKAWSKMSGLKVNEINMNEKTFLSKVNWKLHIPEALFKRWTEIVLRFTPNMQQPTLPSNPHFLSGLCWKSIVPLLTPELDTIPMYDGFGTQDATVGGPKEISSPVTPLPQDVFVTNKAEDMSSNNATPVPTVALPPFLEPKTDLIPPTPALARMGPLPTPMLTPASNASSTPAAMAWASRRSSMTSAMAFASKLSLSRCSMDQHPSLHSGAISCSSRLPVHDFSNASSPESMMTDRTFSSRASSISSVSSVTTSSTCPLMAPGRACLARQATCRNAGLLVPIRDEKEHPAAYGMRPSIIPDDMDLTSSPEIIDFRVSDKALLTPHRHSKNAVVAVNSAVPTVEKSRKRGCPRGGRRSNLQEEVRMLLEEEFETMMDVDENGSLDSSPSPVGLAKAVDSLHIPSPYTHDYAPYMLMKKRSNARALDQREERSKRPCYPRSRTIGA